LTSRRSIGLVAAVASFLFGVSSADATVYRARWDPVFNVSFSTDVGWSGEASIDVSNSCVLAGVIVDFTSGPCLGQATLIGFTVRFYDVDTNGNIVTTVGTGPGLPDPTKVSFDSNGIADGMDLFAPPIPFSYLAGTFGAYSQSAGFDAELAFTITGGPVLSLFEQVSEGDTYVSGLCEGCVPVVRWTPEPGTLALMGLALASLAAIHRRRGAAARAA
jgi:hypothetical protein